MKYFFRIWVLATACTIPAVLLAQSQWSMSELNLVHQYDPSAEIFVKSQPQVDEDSLTLFISLEINQGKPKLADYTFDLFLLNSLEEKLNGQKENISKDSLLIASFKNNHLLKFTLPYAGQKWAVIRVNSRFSGFNHYFEVPLNSINLAGFTIQNTTVEIDNYLQPDTYQSSEDITAFYYNHEFSPAIPPMVTKAPLPEKSLEIDSVFSWKKGITGNLRKPGLYYLQTDTSTTVGRGFLLTHKYFPQPATLEQLKEPLIYITTLEERQNIEQITTKAEFDQFWLELTDSPERARSIIREFYNRVETANKWFTSFKEGWKTDPGMIYIIFGTPDEVIKKDQSETWVYLSDTRLPKIKFEFIRSNNIFSSTYYSLIRDKKYSNAWYRAIDLWRKSRF